MSPECETGQARRPLSCDRIVHAAVEVADRSGLDELSMRRLGGTLGCEAMSLYRYFPSKGDLLEAMASSVLGDVEAPRDGDDWRAAMRRFARSYRAVGRRHPRLLPLIVRSGREHPTVTRARARVRGVLLDAGFDDDSATWAEAAVMGYATGVALTADPERDPLSGAEEVDFEFGLDALLSGFESKLGQGSASG